MSADITMLGSLGTLSVIYLFYILAKLSQRLGSVERMSPYYRYYYLAIGFAIVGTVSHVVVARVALSPQDFPNWLLAPWFLFLAHYLPLAIGATVGLLITWRYWSWLILGHTR